MGMEPSRRRRNYERTDSEISEMERIARRREADLLTESVPSHGCNMGFYIFHFGTMILLQVFLAIVCVELLNRYKIAVRKKVDVQ